MTEVRGAQCARRWVIESNEGEKLMIKKTLFIATVAMGGFAISGCSIKQNVRPVETIGQTAEICVARMMRCAPDFSTRMWTR